MSTHLGDVIFGDTVYFLWSTNASDGASITRTVPGNIRVYKGGSAQDYDVAGITDIVDFDSITGIHSVAIATSGSFYQTGRDYNVVIVDTEVDSVRDLNAPLAHFSIQNRNPNKPTAAYRKQTANWYIESPTSGDSNESAKYVPDAATITELVFQVDTGTADFNIEIRNRLTPDTAGTEILAADDIAGTTGEQITSFNVTAIPAGSWLVLDVSAVSSATRLHVAVAYTIN